MPLEYCLSLVDSGQVGLPDGHVLPPHHLQGSRVPQAHTRIYLPSKINPRVSESYKLKTPRLIVGGGLS